MPEEIKPVNQKGYIAPIVTDYVSSATPSDRTIDPYALMEQRLANTDRQSNTFTNVDTTELPGTGRYAKIFPGENMEEFYAQGQTWSSKMVNDLGKGLALTGTTLLQSTLGLANGIYQSIADGRAASFYDNEFNRNLDELNKDLENRLPNYYTQKEKSADWYSPDKLFTANFLWDGIIKNMGFAAGAALSGGVYASGLKALTSIPQLAKLFSVGKAAETLAATEEALLGANKAADVYGKVKGLSDKFLGSYRSLDAGQRALVAGLATTGEAGFEAYHNLNDFRNKKIEEYKAANGGLAPSEQELAKINRSADSVGNASFLLNTALLTATNYIQFPKILGSSTKLERGIINSTVKEISEVTFDAAGKAILKPKNIISKIAPYVFSASEAFEEGAQYAIGVGAQDYYNKKHKGSAASFGESLGLAIAETVTTNEGIENILIGGLSGSLMQGPGKFKESRQKKVDTATAMAAFDKSTMSDFTKETMDSVKRGIVIQEDREDELKKGNTANVKDLATDYIINYLTPRIKFGRFDLVKSDIEDYRRLASTEEGFAQLQADGKALADDTREAYMERLNGLESTAENVKSLYQSLTLRYGNLITKDGKPAYSEEVMDKMIYTATKVADYDKRIPQLINRLASANVFSADVVRDKELFAKALAEIEALPIIKDDKLDMIQDLNDLKTLTTRRDKFLQEYSDIKEAPQNYTTPETTETAEPGVKIKVKTKDGGDEELEVGVEYYAGAKEIEVEEGGTIQKFSKFKLLGETDDGLSIKILLPNNTTMVVLKSALEQYNIGKVLDTDKRENAKFFIETTDHIFTYNLGKGVKKEGRLSYDKTTDKLTFTSLDGKFKRQVTRDQFEAKQGFDVAQIYSNKKFTPKADEALKAKVEASEKLATRNKIIVDLYNNSKKRLDEVLATLDKNKNKLASLEEALDNVTKTAKGLPRKKLTKAITKTINELSKMKQDIELQNAQLQAEKEELEATLPFFQDMADNIGEFDAVGNNILTELKEDIDAIEEMINNTDDAIKQGNSLIKTIDSALKTALDLFNDFVKRVKEENPNVPFLLSDFQDRLEKYMGEEGAKQFIADKLGFTELVMELEESMEDFNEELKIPAMENKLKKLQEQLKELSTGLDELINKQMAKAKVLEAFEQYAENYKRQQEEERRLAKDSKLRQEILGINSTDVQNEASTAKAYEPNSKKDWWEVLGSTIASIFEGKEHQLRADRFGNRFHKIVKDTPIKGIVVNITTQEDIVPGLMEHLAGTSGVKPENTIALVMVQVNEDGSFTPVDEFGKPIPEGANMVDTAIYQVFPSEELMQRYKDSKGNWVRESMFRDDVANNKDLKLALEQQYKAWRTEQLAQKVLGAPREITAAFGTVDYVKTKNSEGKDVIDYNAQVSASEAGLVTDADLAVDPLVSVATNNDSITEGSVTFNTPLGRIFLKVPGGLVKLLNRKFNVKEANLMVDVLKQIASNTFDDRTVKTDRSTKLINWLKSVAYWGIAKNTQTGERKKAGYNNIWFEDIIDENGDATTQLFVSGKGGSFKFTPTSIEDSRTELVALFTAMYNNANATMLNKKAYNNPYFEITGLNADGTPIVKEWKNYQTFLLSSKGREKGEVPFTTAFKPITDENSTNRKAIYFTLTDTQNIYTFPQPKAVVKQTPVNTAAPVAAPATPTAPTTPQQFKFDGVTPNPVQLNSGPVTFTIDIEEYRKTPNDPLAAGFTVTPDPTTLAVATLKRNNDEQDAINWITSSTFVRIKPMLDAQLVPAPVSTIDVTPEQDVAFDEEPVDAPSDEVYRLQNQKEASKFEGENWTKFQEWLKTALPNIPVYRVKNVIQATNGRQAWGMFRNGAIYIYENAEIGTAYHEVFHAVMSMFTDPVERQILMDEFRKRKGTFTALTEQLEDTTIKYSEATDKQAEEQLAEEFKEFVLSGKKYKPEGSKYSIVRFFSELVDFIKEMLLGPNAPNNTEKLFNKIGNGYFQKVIPFESNLNYAKAGIIDIEDARGDDKSTFSIAKIPQTQVHEIMEHMTFSVLNDLSKNNKSLFSASAVLNKTEKYNELKDEILKLIKWRASDAKGVDKSNFKILEANVENEWENLKKKHIEYLKTYNVEFDENDEAIVKDEEASGKSDWQDARKIDSFKKINATIRLAIGTLPIMEVQADGSLKPVRSSIGGMKLIPIDKSYITLMNELHSSVNFDQMMAKLRAFAIVNPSYAALYYRLTQRKATDPGVNYNALNDPYNVQLISGFWRAFKKQNADVQLVFTLPSGEVIVSDSSLSTAASQERSNMAASIISSIRTGNDYVKYDTTKKEYTSQAAVKNYKLVSDKLETYTDFLKKFGIEFDPKELRKKIGSNANQLSSFRDAVEGLQESLSQLSDVKSLTTKTLAIDGRLLQLGTIKAIMENPDFESTYFNLNGDRVQTYLGTNLLSDMYDVISNIKNYNTLGSSKYARLTTDAFSKGSATLNRMFNITGEDADGRRVSNTEDLMKTGYVDGFVNEQTNKKKESSRLNLKERIIQEINLNLNGFYMNLVPGDASIEWMVKLGEFVNSNTFKNKGYEAINEIFREYFISEVNVAREDRPIVKLLKLTPAEIKAGKQRESTDLRFFKSILSKEDHDAVVKMLSSKKTAKQIYDAFEGKVKSAVENKIKAEAKISRATLNKYGAVTTNEEGELVTEGISFENYDGMTSEQLDSQLELLAANYMMANIELHKLVYSDPYQYKDELKRIKNFNSPRQPLLANSQAINAMIDRAYNKDFDPEDKIGYTDFIRDYFRSITLTDVVSKSDLKDYGVFDETDGGGYISMKANRNLRLRAGQWNDLEERQYRFDVKFEKAVKNGASSEELAKMLKKENPNIKSAYTPVKPIVAGDKEDGNNWNDVVLDKFALFPLSFRLLHELNPDSNAIKLYNKMQEEDIDYAVYNTGRKVGAKTTVSLYEEGGKFNDAPINEAESVSNIPFDIIGIQAEVPSKDTNDTTQGSQITKLVTMDFMSAGVPVDFAPEITDMDDRFAAWMDLKDKASYNNGDNLYNDILTNRRILEEKINHGFDTLIDKMGIVKTDKGLKLKYKKKLIDTLKNEMYKREVNDNIIEAFDNFEDGQVILEATPAYQQIRNILYSIADSSISSQKINGGLKVQVPVTLLEAVRAEVDPETGAYVSKELKFYEKDGERVCEIMVAKWFDDSQMTEEEALEFFNSPEGQDVLRGVAYRIPTQSQNSIDVFKIAKFLPKGYGDSVIVPSELVRKVGSDFDIDKLSIYLKNIYKDGTGKIRLVPFHGFGEDAKSKFGELFDSIIKDKKEFAETNITKLSGMQNLWSEILAGNASDKYAEKWIPIFKNIYGEDLTGVEIAQALEIKLEKAGKDVDKLTNADLLAAAKEEFIEKYYGKSLENAYIASLQKLITNPANFDQLVAPNDAQELKDLAYEINEKLGVPQPDYSSTGVLLSREKMTGLRHDFVSGKQGIGIAATANTNHAQNQLGLIYIDPTRNISALDKRYIKDGDIKLPHNQLTVGEERRATLSMINDVAGRPISDIIGMFIDGYVDISKGAWIMDLGARLNTASTWLFLTKVGVPIKTTAYFMNQPIIKQYLQTIENQGYSWLFIDQFISDTKESYDSGAVTTTEMPNEKALGKMVGKSVEDLSPLERAQQQLVLDEFLKYAKMAEHLFKVQQATSFDTASFNDPTLLFKKSEQIKAARNTVISSVDDLLENSFVGHLAEVLNDVGEAYADVLISEKPRVKGVVNAVLKDYINLNDRDFVGLARKTINNLFDWATQIDKKINQSLAVVLLGTDTAQSFAEQIMKFKYTVLNTPNHPLKDNIIINSIQMKKSDKDGVPDNLYISGKTNKIYNQNQIIYGFKEIKNNVPKQLYGKLVRVAVMQSGLSNSPISFSSLLPYEDFKEIYNDTLANLENMSNLADFLQLNVMERTLYSDANIVPSKKAAWIKTKAKKMMYGLEIKFLSKRLRKAMNDKKIPQMINISKLSREGASDIITYTWENQSYTKAQKAAMRKKGNYSYINKGLFKKVYGADGTALVYPSTSKDGITYLSYVYKAINTWGDSFRANEFYGKMFPDNADSTLAQKGIFDNGYIKADEVEDGVIEEIMGDEVFTEGGSPMDAYDLGPEEILEDYSQATGLPMGTPEIQPEGLPKINDNNKNNCK